MVTEQAIVAQTRRSLPVVMHFYKLSGRLLFNKCVTVRAL